MWTRMHQSVFKSPAHLGIPRLSRGEPLGEPALHMRNIPQTTVTDTRPHRLPVAETSAASDGWPGGRVEPLHSEPSTA